METSKKSKHAALILSFAVFQFISIQYNFKN